MSQAPTVQRQICPHCGALTRPRMRMCWLCGAAVRLDWPALAPGQVPTALPARRRGGSGRPVPAGPPRRFQFGLSTLLLIMTLCAVLLSIWKMAPGLAAVLTFVVFVGFAGLVERSLTAARRGESLTAQKKVLAFFRPLWIVGAVLMAIAVVAVVGFLVICAPMFRNIH